MKMITSVSLRKAHVHEWSLKGVGQIQGLIPLPLCMNSLQKFGTTIGRKRDWADLCEVTFISGTIYTMQHYWCCTGPVHR